MHDLHVSKLGQPVGDGGTPAYRVTALECGPVGVAHRLGYGHRDLAGPWPLHLLLGKLTRNSWLVDWDHVAAISDDEIRLSVNTDRLRHLGSEQTRWTPADSSSSSRGQSSWRSSWCSAA